LKALDFKVQTLKTEGRPSFDTKSKEKSSFSKNPFLQLEKHAFKTAKFHNLKLQLKKQPL
jgi:hypothetical protein